MKVVINNCFGGFSLSPEATIKLWQLGGPVEALPIAEAFKNERPDSPFTHQAALAKWHQYLANPEATKRSSLFVSVFSPDESLVLYARDCPRNDPLLVQVVEEMGDSADGSCAALKIVEVPDDAEWEIAEYDGNEHVAEKHRVWS